VARRFRPAAGERIIVRTTPTSWGLTRPALLTIVSAGLIMWGSFHAHLLHTYEGVTLAALTGPSTLVLVGRVWRWRSHTIYVTDQQIVVEGGVLNYFRSTCRLDEVLVVGLERRFTQRLRRRGVVQITTRESSLDLGPLRHPDALVRLIEQARRETRPRGAAYDTVFEPTEDPDWWK